MPLKHQPGSLDKTESKIAFSISEDSTLQQVVVHSFTRSAWPSNNSVSKVFHNLKTIETITDSE